MHNANEVDRVEEIPPAVLVHDLDLDPIRPYSRRVWLRFVLEKIFVLTCMTLWRKVEVTVPEEAEAG